MKNNINSEKNTLQVETEAIQESFDVAKKGFIAPATKEKWKMYIYKFSHNKFSVLGLIIVLISIFFGIFALNIVPYPEHITGYVDFSNASKPPSSQHWCGTDICGRDVFSRLIYSFRGALLMAIVVLGISVPVGVFLGLMAGYYNGTFIDTIIMRITDIFLSIPALILALAIAAVLKPTLTSSMIAASVVWWTWYTRMVYGLASSISKEYYIRNAELIGASKFHIIFREILPGTLSPVLTKMALDVCWIILLGASLSYAGLGEQPPMPAFGTMLSEGSKYMPEQWWMTIFPAAAISFVILGFNFLGDGIRDMLDKGRG